MTELIDMTRDELQLFLPKEKLAVKGECLVAGFKDELLIAVSRIIQFLAKRMRELAADAPLWVHIHCEETDSGPQVSFRDYSRRLPEPLRQRLFSPFAEGPLFASGDDEFQRRGLHLPLYLAKSLVEVKHGGALDDRSDELPGDSGHCFVMSLPAASLIG